MIDRRKLAGLMVFYFFVTYAVLVVTFYASFLIDDYKIDSSFSGVLISLFFPLRSCCRGCSSTRLSVL